jgi:hypothetical protein
MSTQVASNTTATTIGGDFWTFGTVGLAVKGNTTVKQRFINGPASDLNSGSLNGPFDYGGKTTHIYGDAIIKGTITGTSGTVTIDGAFSTQMTCGSVPPGVTGSCTSAMFPNLPEPCGAYDNSDKSLVPVASIIVPYFRDPTHNDNALIGLKYNALDNPTGALHLDLPCGVYYLNSINASQVITIAVHGRTTLVVGGMISVIQNLIVDVDPTASLDVFLGGVLDVPNLMTFGTPAFPRLTRVYVGSASCMGSGTCDEVSDCCSGRCSACPTDADGKPTGACTGSGSCTSIGGNKANAISLSQSPSMFGLFWAGYGKFTHSSALEMYGSINVNYFDAADSTLLHYDNGAALLGKECPAPTSCTSCRQCNGQACIGAVCSSCSADSQCCPPLRCVGGSCTL